MHTVTLHRGFTLIELSIVLVIIGLIVGGVLVGQDLIRAAEVRATITQIEKYNTAANTFRGKYDYLPGDIKDPDASMFGFQPRGQYPGEGDGNSLIEGVVCDGGCPHGGYVQATGETAMFWADLSRAALMEGTFTAASPTVVPSLDITNSTAPSLSAFFPAAKLGRGNFIYVEGGGLNGNDGHNYFSFSAPSLLAASSHFGNLYSTPGLTVSEAYSIDRKMDDGLPQTGAVVAMYLNNDFVWAAGGGNIGASDTSATPGSATTCYDNGNAAAATQQYSMQQNGGVGINCALSFQFQ